MHAGIRSCAARRWLVGLAMSFAAPAPGAAPPPLGTTETVGPKATTVIVDGRQVYSLGFDILSAFTYTLVDAGTGATPEQIAAHLAVDPVPAWVRIYDGKVVRLTGYMLPLKLEKGRATQFVLMRDQNTCCYGAVPNMNDYLVVTMRSAGVEAVQDVPVDVIGTFRIDHRYEDGYVVSLFALEGERFLGPRK